MMEAAMSFLVPHMDTTQTSTQQESNTNGVRRMDEPFPLKLHRLLEDVENTPQADILSWDPDGRSFTIFQPKAFADSIMGQYFRQTKYKSFQRQMNLYGFTREVRGKIRGVYSHPRFIRHDRDLCLQIKRTTKAPTSTTTPAGRFFGAGAGGPASSSSQSLGSLKTGVTNATSAAVAVAASSKNATTSTNNNIATSIDVSSPLFAPLGLPSSQSNTNNNAAINLGLGGLSPTTTKALISSSRNNNNNNNFVVPNFTFPSGGLTAFASASRVSLDDEESMGTIDELPNNTMMSSFQHHQQQQQHLLGEEETPSSEEFGAVAV